VEFRPFRQADTALLLPLADPQSDEPDAAAAGLDQTPYPLGEARPDGRLGREGETDRAADASGVGEHRCPELLAQPDKRLRAEREHRGQQVDDEVVVKDREPEPRLHRPRDRELPRRRRTMQEDEIHPQRLPTHRHWLAAS